MPFAKCPQCGAEFHLGVGDIEAWYREFWPGYQVGDIVPAECFTCWRKGGESGSRPIIKPRIKATDDREKSLHVGALLRPGDYRWAIFDHPRCTLHFGSSDVHIHMTVAEQAGVLRNPPEYYRPGNNVLGGYLCRAKDAAFYFDPYSGTFPGTEAGVAEAEETLRIVCQELHLPFCPFASVAAHLRATCHLLADNDRGAKPAST